MVFMQGNTYKIPVEVDTTEIQKIVFGFKPEGKKLIEKIYLSDGSGDVVEEDGKLYLKFTQEETLTFDKEVKMQVAIKFNNEDEDVSRSYVIKTTALDTIIKKAI